jgi:cytochrome c553
MHNSLNGTQFNGSATGGLWIGAQYEAGAYLLQGDTSSTACLNCHETAGDYGISTKGVNTSLTTLPANYDKSGGDFSWIKTSTGNKGDTRGHNIVSPYFGYNPDGTRTVSPGGDAAFGGTLNASDLGCSACHDPHGTYRRLQNDSGVFVTSGAPIVSSGSHGEVASATEAVGSYRLLAGIGYNPKGSTVAGTSVTFMADPPVAAAVSYGNADKVSYGQGMSEWCGNCHGLLIENTYVPGAVGHTHPAGDNATFKDAQVTAYNNYMGSGVVSGTVKFGKLVPLEEGNAAWQTLYTNAQNTAGVAASTSSNANCVSCHRAHATGFTSMTRFDTSMELITTETGAWETGAFNPSNLDNYMTRAYNNNIQDDGTMITQRTLLASAMRKTNDGNC